MVMNNLAAHQRVLERLTPWSGAVPDGFIVDFLGALTDVEFRLDWGVTREMTVARTQNTTTPTIGSGDNGELWFEAVNWVETVQAARGSYTMMMLGACYGGAESRRGERYSSLIRCPVSWCWLNQNLRISNGLSGTFAKMELILLTTGLFRRQSTVSLAPFFFPSGHLAPARS